MRGKVRISVLLVAIAAGGQMFVSAWEAHKPPVVVIAVVSVAVAIAVKAYLESPQTEDTPSPPASNLPDGTVTRTVTETALTTLQKTTQDTPPIVPVNAPANATISAPASGDIT